MGVQQAILAADAQLPGEPVEDGVDPRWQAIIAVGEYVGSSPEDVWEFVQRWGRHPQEDLRDAIATCLLEHLLEHHFASYFPRVRELALSDAWFGDTMQRCWKFGEAKQPVNAKQFDELIERLDDFPL